MALGIIGGILFVVGLIASLVFWIMAIVKAFKAGETVWGVLSIFISICALIYAFIGGHKKLGINMIIAGVVTAVGYVMGAAGIFAEVGGMEAIQQQMEEAQQLQQQ